MTSTPTTNRKPWIACVLSLFCTGLGHIYCGHAATGLILFLASLLFVPITFVAALVDASNIVLTGLILVVIAELGVYLFAVVDAARIARRLKGEFAPRQYNRLFIYALLIFLGIASPLGAQTFLKSSAFEAFKYVGNSMSPSFLSGDRVLVNKTAYRDMSIRRGDVIAFRSPGDRRQVYIKRAIALPGDRVAIVEGRVIINDCPLERRAIAAHIMASSERYRESDVYLEIGDQGEYMIACSPNATGAGDFSEATVPLDHCFVLGDNRDNSRDSRHFGCIPLADVVGGVEYNFYPMESWSRYGALDQ